MSKLYNNYLYLKSNEVDSNNTLYLFKSGMFFIFLDDDARIASSLLNLKLTCLTENIVKCGFPINSLDKYKKILERTSYNVKIIDSNNQMAFTINNYNINNTIFDLLSKINKIDSSTLSIKEAYEFIDDIKDSAQSILKNCK